MRFPHGVGWDPKGVQAPGGAVTTWRTPGPSSTYFSVTSRKSYCPVIFRSVG